MQTPDNFTKMSIRYTQRALAFTSTSRPHTPFSEPSSSLRGRILGTPRPLVVPYLAHMEQILIQEIVLPHFRRRDLVPAQIGKSTFRVKHLVHGGKYTRTLFEDASRYQPSYPSSNHRLRSSGCTTTWMLAPSSKQWRPSPSPPHLSERGRTSRSDPQGDGVSKKTN